MRPSISAGLLIVAVAFASIVSAVGALAISLHPFAEMHGGLIEPIRACGRIFREPEVRAVLATSLVTAVVAVHFGMSARAWRRARLRLRQLELLFSLLPAPEPSPRVRDLARRAGLAGRLVLIDSPEPLAFTAGLMKPSVYLSTGAARVLNDYELEAVLRHEEHHRATRDPLKIQLIAALQGALDYVPAVRHLSQMFLRERECAADDAALCAMQSVRPLLMAFVKLGELDVNRPAALAGYSDFAPERISRLLGSASAGQLSDVKSLVRAGLASLFIFVSLPLLALLLTEPQLASILGLR